MLGATADPLLVEAWGVREERHRVMRALRAVPADVSVGRHSDLLVSELHRLDEAWSSLWEDPEAHALIVAEFDRRVPLLRAAIAAWHEEQEQEDRDAHAASLVAEAARTGRPLLRVEAEAVERLRAPAAAGSGAWKAMIVSPDARDGVLSILTQLRIRRARHQLHQGLLLTDQMRQIIAEALPALLRGEPLLLLGETGGAKTALAEYVSRELMGHEPELVSGYGDISSAQLVGAHELRVAEGATVSVFVPGPLIRAMVDGRPLILDELNAMPPEFLKRLNRVLQLRPGDRFSVQENGGEVITIAPGFAILATANEQTPHRYRGIDRLSAELVNRFGANAYRVRYPDADHAFTDVPSENLLLATAAVADPSGTVPLSTDELLRAARAAFISQQVFAGSVGEGFQDFVSTERRIDGRPGLEESVLAPRTLVAILRKVAGSGGSISLEHAMQRFVDGVMHAEDRHVLALILESQGFAPRF